MNSSPTFRDAAINICTAVKAQLFVPSSQEEYSNVTSYLDDITTPEPTVMVWIGCDDLEVEGTFKCTDGTSFNSNSGRCMLLWSVA